VHVADEQRERADEHLFRRGAAFAHRAAPVDGEAVVTRHQEQGAWRARLGVVGDGLGSGLRDVGQLAEHGAAGGLHARLHDVELVDLARAHAHAAHELGGATAGRLGLVVERRRGSQRLDAAGDGLQLADGRRGKRTPEEELVGERGVGAELGDDALLDHPGHVPAHGVHQEHARGPRAVEPRDAGRGVVGVEDHARALGRRGEGGERVGVALGERRGELVARMAGARVVEARGDGVGEGHVALGEELLEDGEGLGAARRRELEGPRTPGLFLADEERAGGVSGGGFEGDGGG
jgi:hypothetical protein